MSKATDKYSKAINDCNRIEYDGKGLSFAEKISKIADFHLNATEEDYLEYARIREYLKYDQWDEASALLLLCGVDTYQLDVQYNDCDNKINDIGSANIIRAIFFSEKDSYDSPARNDINQWIEIENKNREKKSNHLESGKYKKDEEGELLKEINAIDDFILMLKEDFFNDKEFKKEWDKRSYYSWQLTHFRAIWFSGEHKEKNSISYYLEWAENKNLEIPWLNWAKENNLLPDEYSHRKTVQNDDEPITGDMKKTLAETMKMIDSFKNSNEFKRYGKETQIKVIKAWLEAKDLTEHKIRHITELITSHYGITTSRK